MARLPGKASRPLCRRSRFYPTPNDAQKAKGICRVCAGNDPAAAEAAFRARLAALGAELLEPKWLGAQKKHRVRCSAGHECSPRPSDVRQGHGICRTCVGQDPVTAEAALRARLAELGAEMLGPYVNTKTPVAVRCAAGHDCSPAPGSVLGGNGICLRCAGMDIADSEAKFLARLAELGAKPAYDRYRGANKPHHVICAAGHGALPRPGGVRLGRGICATWQGLGCRRSSLQGTARRTGSHAPRAGMARSRQSASGEVPRRPPDATRADQRPAGSRHLSCAGSEWNAFYIVTGSNIVKFGITTGNGRHRLAVHAAKGFANVVCSQPTSPALSHSTPRTPSRLLSPPQARNPSGDASTSTSPASPSSSTWRVPGWTRQTLQRRHANGFRACYSQPDLSRCPSLQVGPVGHQPVQSGPAASPCVGKTTITPTLLPRRLVSLARIFTGRGWSLDRLGWHGGGWD